jgi:DNA-binding NarL/FixJ family response regulator
VTRVVLVEDHPLSVHALESVLTRAGHEVVAVASDVAEGVAAIRRHRPQVAIVDLNLRGGGGIEVVRTVRDLPQVRVIVHTGSLHGRELEEVLAERVAGVTSKLSPLAGIVHAVTEAAAGRFHIDDEVKEALAAGQPTLTVREREILQLIASGQSLDEVAAVLVVSPDTVRTHLANARRKLGARNRTEAVVAAMRTAQIRMPEAS